MFINFWHNLFCSFYSNMICLHCSRCMMIIFVLSLALIILSTDFTNNVEVDKVVYLYWYSFSLFFVWIREAEIRRDFDPSSVQKFLEHITVGKNSVGEHGKLLLFYFVFIFIPGCNWISISVLYWFCSSCYNVLYNPRYPSKNIWVPLGLIFTPHNNYLIITQKFIFFKIIAWFFFIILKVYFPSFTSVIYLSLNGLMQVFICFVSIWI